MYSQDEVTKLLEVQRESIMKVEAANNKLIVSGLIERCDMVAEKLITMKTRNKNLWAKIDMYNEKQIEIQAELDSLHQSLHELN